jgi:hypothetical protein
MRRIAPLGLLLLAAACTTDPQQYIGESGDRLYLAWGSPVATERLPGGEQRLVFLRDQCLTSFVLAYNGVVKSASNRGGGCPGR